MKPPAVYKAIAAITAELSRSGIAKNSRNEQEGWAFRGIDDVYNALSPLLAKHKLCILPRIVDRDAQQRRHGPELLSHVALRVAFEFVSAADGSSHSVEIWGEGVDRSDKATNKAFTAAYKYAAFQVFCIPVGGQVDADAETLRCDAAGARPAALEPVQGWEQWARDITDMIGRCETVEALQRVQVTYRGELRALSACDAADFKRIGDAVAELRKKLAAPPAEHERQAIGRQPSDPAKSGSAPTSAMGNRETTTRRASNQEVSLAAAAN